MSWWKKSRALCHILSSPRLAFVTVDELACSFFLTPDSWAFLKCHFSDSLTLTQCQQFNSSLTVYLELKGLSFNTAFRDAGSRSPAT